MSYVHNANPDNAPLPKGLGSSTAWLFTQLRQPYCAYAPLHTRWWLFAQLHWCKWWKAIKWMISYSYYCLSNITVLRSLHGFFTLQPLTSSIYMIVALQQWSPTWHTSEFTCGSAVVPILTRKRDDSVQRGRETLTIVLTYSWQTELTRTLPDRQNWLVPYLTDRTDSYPTWQTPHPRQHSRE